jgi:hypothetical protein
MFCNKKKSYSGIYKRGCFFLYNPPLPSWQSAVLIVVLCQGLLQPTSAIPPCVATSHPENIHKFMISN